MPTFVIPLPDGTSTTIETPEGGTREMAAKFAEREYRETAKRAGALASIVGGATLNFNDEMTGFLQGVTEAATGGEFSEGYERGRDLTREAKRIFGEDHPIMQIALELGGGMLTGAGLFKALQLMTKGRAGLTATGVLEGTVAGAGAGESAEDRLMGAGIGATVGGAMGKGVDIASRTLPGLRAGGQAQRAQEAVLAGKTGAEAGQEIADLNRDFAQPWARYADVNPEYAQTAAVSAPPGQAQEFSEMLTQRQRMQAPLVEQATRDITEIPDSRTAARSALEEQLRREGDEMYSPLRGQPAAPTAEMMETLGTPNGQRAAEHTLNAMREQSGNAALGLPDVQNSWDFWHNYQQVLRDIGSGKMNATAPLSGIEGRAVLNRRANVMRDLFGEDVLPDDMGPAYQAATARFRDNIELIEALDSSEKFQSLTRDQVSDALSRLKTEDERLVFAAGAVNDLIEKAMRNPDTADIARKMVRTPALRQNLEQVLGEEKLNRLDDAMTRLSKMTETHNEVVRVADATPAGKSTAHCRGRTQRAGIAGQCPVRHRYSQHAGCRGERESAGQRRRCHAARK